MRQRAILALLPIAALFVALALPARADTILRLGETATVMAHPDELVATLRAEANAPTAAEAQRRVNTAMAGAVAAARQVTGVATDSGGYFVWHVMATPQDRNEHWQANQSLTLTSHDGAALLKLVGELQQKGLAVSQLGWRLSDAATRAAEAEATRKAIATLRGRAEEAAALLDLRFGAFKEVRLNGTRPQPVPLRMIPAAMAAAPAPPPSAEASDVSVSATAEADVILVPK
jgi:predicted secreted protein